MTFTVSTTRTPCEPIERGEIELRLRACPCLPSLASIDKALQELLGADHRYTSQIAEIIRRDPSLTSRLLRLVNSVHYGISKPIKNVEEAVFYLGVRQIRQLAMVTPIIEDFQNLAGSTRLAWRGFWQHCIGTALMTREVIDLVNAPRGETDYVAGLIHDVGKIVMASAFPKHFEEVYIYRTEAEKDLLELEREVLGMDHAELGALYLEKQSLPEIFVETVRYHHEPDQAPQYSTMAAAVQVADLLVQYATIGYSGRLAFKSEEKWRQSSGWKILFGHQSEAESTLTVASLKHSLERIPATIEGLV